jgi:LuxR family transcriptional regulator, maltose regulon positive regulatory protein
MLETLEQVNLFIVPLDGERRWYRYHHLFADVLNRRLEQLYPDRLPDLHRRASRWYERNGFISQAIQHARMAGDQQRTAQLVDQNGCLLLMRGEVVNLLQWIEAVEPRSQTLPWIAIQKVWALCLTGQLDRIAGPLHTAEELLSSLELTDDVRTMWGALIAAQACRANMQGETRLATNLARQALARLPTSNDFACSLQSAATSILGDASWMDGELAEAGRAYTQAVLISQAAGNIHMGIVAHASLADVLMEQGQLRQAARIYAETLQTATLPDGQISPLANKIYAGLSRVSYEWNQLEASEDYARQCVALAQRWGSMEFQAIGYVLLAGLEHVRGHPDKARDTMRVAEQLLTAYPHTLWRSIGLTAALARLWISQGDLDRASDLMERNGVPTVGLSLVGPISYPHEPLVLVQLRLHLARGDYAAALELSEGLLQKLEERSRMGRVIEALVLRALAFQGGKDLAQALEVLGNAISLARPEGYQRVFLDEGEAMAKLLYQAKSQRIGGGYAAELLSAMGKASETILPPAQLLIEPLTSRELELLELIAAGCSNQEIADRLIISMPTVKRHISNIYAKLGAGSRTQAVARGKELELFK